MDLLPHTSGAVFRSHRGYKKELEYAVHSEFGPFEILEAACDLPFITATFEKHEGGYRRIEHSSKAIDQAPVRSGDWILKVTLESKAPTGNAEGVLTVKTDSPHRPVFHLPLLIHVADFIPGQRVITGE